MLYGRYRFPGVNRRQVPYPLRFIASSSYSYRTPRMFSLLWFDTTILLYYVKRLVSGKPSFSDVGKSLVSVNTYMFHNRLYQRDFRGRVVYSDYII